jgi:hypothetical protein
MFYFLVSEDHLLEWAQFACWAAAAPAAGVVGATLARRRRWVLTCAWLVLTVGCVGAAGEEISWGQRVIGFETPESLVDANEQNEVTLHNLSSAHAMFRISMLVVGLYGSVGAIAVRWWSRRATSPWADLLFPPPFLTSAFLVLALYRGARILLLPEPGPRVSGYGEWPETCLALGVVAFTVLVWRSGRADAATPSAQNANTAARTGH